MQKKHLRICSKGHTYYKSSDCPTCPVCEKERKPQTGFLSMLGAPARRALEREGISSLKKLATHTEAEILSWHGVGKTTIPKLKAALKAEGMVFASKKFK